MKNGLFFCAFIIIFNSCNQFTKADLPTEILAADLQKVYCSVDLGSAESEITNNRTFLFKHHISPNIDDYPAKPNWQEIDSIYQTAPFDSMNNAEKTVYQQVASVLILRNHALLTSPNEKEKINYYTKTYVESGGKSAGLLFYCIAALGDSLASAQKNTYIDSVVPRATKVVTDLKGWMKTTKATLKGQEFPEGVKASLMKDFANLESIITAEESFVRKLNAIR